MIRWLYLLILLLAFGLRIHWLDAHPLWWDEGLTIHFGWLTPADHLAIAVRTENLNPPVYQQAVGLVMQAAGSSPFAARMLNVWSGTLVVALSYALVRQIESIQHKLPLLTALLMALSPFQIHYAQEAKGYVFIALTLLAGLWLWRRLHAPWIDARGSTARLAHWLAYAATVALALGSNYLVVLLLITENLATLWLTIRAWQRGTDWRAMVGHWVRWLSVQVLGISLLLPFALAALGSTAKGLDDASALWEPFYGVGDYVLNVLRAFTEGPNRGLGPLSLLVGTLALVGLVRWRHRWEIAPWLFGPLILGYLFQLKFPFFSPRFVLYSQPALMILAASGLVAMGRRHAWMETAGAALTLVLMLPGIHAIYSAPIDPQEDWRPLVADMRPFVQTNDLAVYDRAWMPGYLHSYLPPAPEPIYYLGFFDINRLDTQLASLAQNHAHIWLLTYRAGLESPAGAWLRARYPLAMASWYGKSHMALFVTEGAACAANREVHAQFVNGISMSGCTPEDAKAGDILYIPLSWRSSRAQQPPWVAFVHVVDASGALVAQLDAEPRNGTHPTWAWSPGEHVTDDRALALPPSLPTGTYTVLVGLYDRATHTRAVTRAGTDAILLGQLQIEKE